MLLLDSELHPLSPVAELQAWRTRLLELKANYPDPDDQSAIAEALARVNDWLRRQRELEIVRAERLRPKR